MKNQIPETFEIPLSYELRKELEPLLEKKQDKDFKQFIIDLILRGIDDLEDRELGEKAMEAKKSSLMSVEETESFIKET